jgi:hypothetical protein
VKGRGSGSGVAGREGKGREGKGKTIVFEFDPFQARYT